VVFLNPPAHPGVVPRLTLYRLSESLYDGRFTANKFALATSPLRLTTNNFMFQLNTCVYNPYVTSSLTRGWVCRLQVLLVLASAVILRSESRGLITFYYPRFETPQTWRTSSPYLYPPGTGWLGYTPRHWIPFSSPPTTRRATMGAFDADTKPNRLILFGETVAVYC
jgi:hypothetical protein